MYELSQTYDKADIASTQSGEAFRFINDRKKHTLCLMLSDTVENIYLDIKRETWFDKLFKWLKISHEMQLGHKALDDFLYFITDNSEIFNIIKNNTDIKKCLIDIITTCHKAKTAFTSLHIHDGKICLILKNKKSIDVLALAEALVPLLQKISHQLSEKIPHISSYSDPIFFKSKKLKKQLAYNFLFAIFSTFTLIFLEDDYQLVSVKPLLKDAVLCGVFLTILTIILTVIYLGKSARIQSTIKAIALASVISFSIESVIILRHLNIYLDNADATFINTTIYEKYYSARRTTVRKIYSNNKDKDYKTFADKNTYETAEIGNALCLEEMPGFVGYKWIRKLHLRNCVDFRYAK